MIWRRSDGLAAPPPKQPCRGSTAATAARERTGAHPRARRPSGAPVAAARERRCERRTTAGPAARPCREVTRPETGHECAWGAPPAPSWRARSVPRPGASMPWEARRRRRPGTTSHVARPRLLLTRGLRPLLLLQRARRHPPWQAGLRVRENVRRWHHLR